MKNLILKTVQLTLLGVMLFAPISAFSEEDVCAPLKDAQIDNNVLAVMLKAADDGDLYRIQPGSSKMGFCINSPVGKVEAQFRTFNGGIALKDNDPKGRAVVTIDVGSLETSSGIVEAMLKSESFFDSEQYPDIIFVSTDMEWITDKKAILKGDLTMRGITKEVAFFVDLEKVKTKQGEDVVTVKAMTTIQRSEFDMFTLSPMVDDRVNLCMTIDAYRYKA
ncbi:MAG: YceI family protein [Thiotrichaceae bacterium]|nr:YceI family protein [Thiotrichaceae bacterium]